MASFGVIFDADGVLFDSERQSLEALRLAVEESTNGSIELNSQGLEYLCGRDDDSIVELMNKEHGLTIDPAHFRRLKLDRYRRAIAADPIAPMAGAVELIDQLDAESIPYAIATAAIRAKLELTLTTLGLRDRFAVITSVDEVAAGKPDPGVFLLAGERLGLPPARLVVFEDSINGIQAANRAGMFSVGITGTFIREQLVHAQRVVEGLIQVNVSILHEWLDSRRT